MTSNIEALSHKKHKDLKVKRSFSFEDAKKSQFAPLNADEFAYASTCYPILFIKDRNTGRFFSVVLFGLDKEENLFYSSESWSASYVPSSMSLAPFSIGSVETPDKTKQWVTCIDTGSATLMNTDGEALFDGEGESEFLKRNRENLATFHQGRMATDEFIGRLIELELLKSIRFELVYVDDTKQMLDGMYSIDEEAIKKLDPEVVQEFYSKGYFPPAFAQISSKHNLYELIKRKKSQSELAVKSLQVVDD